MSARRYGLFGIGAVVVIVLRSLAQVPSAVPGGTLIYDGVVWAVSLAVTVDSVPVLFGNAGLWLLYLGLFYRLFPTLLPDGAASLGRDRLIRGLFAGCSVGVAAVAFTPGLSGAITPGTAQYRIAGILLGFALFFAVALARRGGDPTTPGTPSFRWLQVFTSGSLTHDSAHPRWSTGLRYAAITGVFVLGAFLLGAVTALLGLLSPVPELILATTAAVASLPRTAGMRRDLETALQEAVRAVFRSHRGITMGMIVLFGFWGALFAIYGGVHWITGVPAQTAGVSVADVRTAMTAGGLMVLAGTLYLWYWQRLARRLPAFAAAWAGDTDACSATTRPPWSVAIPTLLVGLAVLAREAVFAGVATDLLVGVLVVGGGGLAGLWIVQTGRRQPQPPHTDRFQYQLALGGTLLSPAVAVPTLSVGWFATIWVLLSLLSVYPDVASRTLTGAAHRWELFPAYLVGVGTVGTGLLVVVLDRPVVGVGFLGVCIGCAALASVVD